MAWTPPAGCLVVELPQSQHALVRALVAWVQHAGWAGRCWLWAMVQRGVILATLGLLGFFGFACATGGALVASMGVGFMEIAMLQESRQQTRTLKLTLMQREQEARTLRQRLDQAHQSLAGHTGLGGVTRSIDAIQTSLAGIQGWMREQDHRALHGSNLSLHHTDSPSDRAARTAALQPGTHRPQGAPPLLSAPGREHAMQRPLPAPGSDNPIVSLPQYDSLRRPPVRGQPRNGRTLTALIHRKRRDAPPS